MKHASIYLFAIAVSLSACTGNKQSQQTAEKQKMFTGAKGEVKLMTLDPGHFHAALVQKTMYDQIDSTVYVYAPEGEDLNNHLKLIDGYNNRAEDPTSWVEKVYTGADYFQKMLTEKPGNVMVVAGNNAKKTEYIKGAIDAGINVLADKPMAINSENFAVLEQAFKTAGEKGLLLYDIMTERYEITTILQRELSKIPDVFGQLVDGTIDDPAITKESVHHFFKYVSGKPLTRPAWFFDTKQQGEGIVDVTTHLVDLIQWEAFPDQALSKSDVKMLSAKRWTTDLTPEMFKKATGLDQYPDFLKKDVNGDLLKVYSNGEMNYTLKGKYAKVSVTWHFEAPEGGGDTHYSVMRGTVCDLMIKQGAEQNYKPTLYIKANIDKGLDTFEGGLKKAVEQDIATMYPGLKLVKLEDNLWTVDIPEKYKLGHEAHFGQVTKKFLNYLETGQMPEWEVPDMITKYYTTTEALKMALQ